MNKQAIYHYNDSSYCFALDKTHLKLRLKTAKDDADIDHIDCIWGHSYSFHYEQFTLHMEIKHRDELFDYYECIIESTDPRYNYVFKIYLKDGSSYFYSEDGVVPFYDFQNSNISAFKMAYVNSLDIHKRNPRFDGRICYQIFPERFLSASKTIDKSYVNKPWNTTELRGDESGDEKVNGVFLGGDLEGIIEKLDYLKSLNIGIVYMTPICKSSSNHKYNVEDYFMIDPQFGDDDTLTRLVTKAHELDIKIILDLVFNHSSYTNPMFEDVMKNGKNSKYYDFYLVDGDKADFMKRNYETFATCSYMPKLNTNNYKVQDYIMEVSKYFLNKFHIDGYRLDVANEISHAFWQRFSNELRRIDPNILIIGECWNNSYKYLDSREFDSVMNYQFLNATKEFYIYKRLSPIQYKNRLESLLMRYDDNTNFNMLNLIDSHDTERFYDFIMPNQDLYMLAELTLITHIGIPMVYYGDEISMEGSHDPYNRKGMEWDSKEFNRKYFKLFSDILHLRDIATFKYGDMLLDATKDLFIITRYDDKNTYKVIINNSNNVIDYKTSCNVILSNNYKDQKLLPYSFLVYKE